MNALTINAEARLEQNPRNAKLSPRDILAIRALHSEGVTISTLAKAFDVRYQTIWYVLVGHTWRDIP